ncbi:glucosamine-6-phosphate deaminase [Rhodobacterales bacterium]|nr:glucosamine-6-phosphate deaminase [Rhodobacterales bacterium]
MSSTSTALARSFACDETQASPRPRRILRVIELGTPEEAAEATAMEIGAFICSKENAVLGLATGRTMLPVYEHLSQWHRTQDLRLDRCTSFNLDEYCGLPDNDPSSFVSYMHKHLFEKVGMPQAATHFPPVSGAPLLPEAYDDSIRQAGGIDLQLLGIGRNGHIGFNEPGTDPETKTHVVELDASTREANAGDFPDGAEVPTHAVTMGISTILSARRILLLATGEGKSEALETAFKAPVSPDCPASFLQRHPHVTVVCDSAAAAGCKELS